MHHASILATSTLTPEYCYTREQIAPYFGRWLGDDPDLCARAERILRVADIGKRRAVAPIEEVFAARTLHEKNSAYIAAAVPMAAEVVCQALDKAGLQPRDLDCVISVSCTGVMIPSLDAHLIDRLGFRSDIQRLPVMQMGCAGGTAALIYGADYVRAHPGAHVALVSVELPSLTLLLDDRSMANIVSASIFADGAACVILGPSAGGAPALTAHQMHHFVGSAEVMGYELTNSGLRIVLDRQVPGLIRERLEPMLTGFLARQGLTLSDMDHCMFHPGSVKILRAAQDLLEQHGKDLDDSAAILAEHGNMSSATVLFILDRVLERGVEGPARGLMLSFGPGFGGHTLSLAWN